MVVQHDAQGRNEGRVVLQRLPHPHHHHVRNDAVTGLKALAKGMLSKPKLRNDFARSKVSAKALRDFAVEVAPADRDPEFFHLIYDPWDVADLLTSRADDILGGSSV